MRRWRIEGFQGVSETIRSRQVTGGERQVRELLQRLVACHLTEDEVIEATFGSRKYFEITKDAGVGRYALMTTGKDYHYIASVDGSD